MLAGREVSELTDFLIQSVRAQRPMYHALPSDACLEGIQKGKPRVAFLERTAGMIMQEIDEVTLRSKLKRKRDSLFEVFRRHPSKTRLAIEIKLIDDQIASLADKRVNKHATQLTSLVV